MLLRIPSPSLSVPQKSQDFFDRGGLGGEGFTWKSQSTIDTSTSVIGTVSTDYSNCQRGWCLAQDDRSVWCRRVCWQRPVHRLLSCGSGDTSAVGTGRRVVPQRLENSSRTSWLGTSAIHFTTPNSRDFHDHPTRLSSALLRYFRQGPDTLKHLRPQKVRFRSFTRFLHLEFWHFGSFI